MADAAANDFLHWFSAQGGSYAADCLELRDYGPAMGRGVAATRDLSSDQVLFTLPRSLVLSTSTASLPSKLTEKEWESVNQGWVGLILCLLWEASLGSQSKWSPYFNLLPKSFDSLMFWSDAELAELKGSDVLDKIGKQAAEQDYVDKVLPLLQHRPDLFGDKASNNKDDASQPFSMRRYHVMGSLILSRSFNVDPAGKDVEADSSDDEDGGEAQQEGDTSMASAKSQSTTAEGDAVEGDDDQDEEEEEEEGEEGAGHVAMVPFADILNAKSGANNAELSYEQDKLVMKSVKPIAKGEQIYNTYASPPNSDLLRRYGHVDESSEFDVVEIDAQLVAASVSAAVVGAADQQERKIEWLLESGLDDTYPLTHQELVPEELVSSILLFASSSKAFEKMVERSAWPDPQDDKPTLKLLKRVLQARLDQYPTTLEADRELLPKTTGRQHAAIVVRAGEKQILHEAIQHVEKISGTKSDKKRKAGSGTEAGSKRSK